MYIIILLLLYRMNHVILEFCIFLIPIIKECRLSRAAKDAYGPFSLIFSFSSLMVFIMLLSCVVVCSSACLGWLMVMFIWSTVFSRTDIASEFLWTWTLTSLTGSKTCSVSDQYNTVIMTNGFQECCNVQEAGLSYRELYIHSHQSLYNVTWKRANGSKI